jgi:hypothetical protein
MYFAPPGFGAAWDRKPELALTICRQSRDLSWLDRPLAPLRRLGSTLTDSLKTLAGRGAVERVLWLPNRALYASFVAGLLRRDRLVRQSDSSAWMRAWTGTEPAGAGGAGAPKARRLTRLLHTFYRASLIVGGRTAPSSPCMNELPSHAPTINSRLLCPLGMYVRPFGAGFKKLY